MLKDEGRCFACGRFNERGLKLPIRKTADGVELDYTVPEQFEGWRGIIHGGIVATILDELLAWACKARDLDAVTAELQVRFRQPLRSGQPIRGSGRIVSTRGRLILAESRLVDDAGRLIAEASGKMMRS